MPHDRTTPPGRRPALWANAPHPPRPWQREALPTVLEALEAGQRGVVVAATGSGKSNLQAELVRAWFPVVPAGAAIVVGVPSVALVGQLARTMRERLGPEVVGEYHAQRHERDRPVVVTCYASAVRLGRDLAAQGRTVALLVADEVHRTEAASVRAALEALQPERAVGFSATAYRADDRETLSLWERVIFRYEIGDALADGVLVPFDVHHWDGIGAAGNVDAIVLRMIREHGEGPGAVSAMSIADAESCASYLTSHGARALAVHSRLGASEVGRRLDLLRDGQLDAVVHVALLVEGVDLPWLRWLALRRPVQSRVRLVQEVGRVLRSHPGKDRAALLDPHDLLGIHGLTHTEALGEPLPVEPGPAREREDEPETCPSRMPPAVAIDAVTSWLRQTRLKLELAGLPRRTMAAGSHWHGHKPSDRQVRALTRMAWTVRLLPAPLQADVGRLVSPTVSPRLSRLACSEILTLLGMVADAKTMASDRGERWLWPSRVGAAPAPAGALEAFGGDR